MVATDLHDTIEFAWTKECGMHTPFFFFCLMMIITYTHICATMEPTITASHAASPVEEARSYLSDRQPSHADFVLPPHTKSKQSPSNAPFGSVGRSTLAVVIVGGMLVWGYQARRKRQVEVDLARRKAVEEDQYPF